MTMVKQVKLITMIGGTDIIGELDSSSARLRRPCVVRFTQKDASAPVLQLQELLRGSPFLTGEYIELNMLAVQWAGTPPRELELAWRQLISGLTLPNGRSAPVINQ
jgi:hypothetical protein